VLPFARAQPGESACAEPILQRDGPLIDPHPAVQIGQYGLQVVVAKSFRLGRRRGGAVFGECGLVNLVQYVDGVAELFVVGAGEIRRLIGEFGLEISQQRRLVLPKRRPGVGCSTTRIASWGLVGTGADTPP